MQLKITLSKKEKRYYFIYLLAMLLLGVVFLGIIFLSKLSSPFGDSDSIAIKTLQQKSIFDMRQKAIQPKVDSTFIKLKRLSSEKPQPVEENELRYDINDINDAFSDLAITDSRKNNYNLIAKFYKMYYDDKKVMVKKNENVKRFTKQFEDCTIGMKDMQQQINQRKNAQIMGARN
ncbi:type VI secretion system TssO [Kaistella carnis]|uniref:type VI secretion system TssO n=1 Tax=Kaistella carnis TaxID=1241979 RepID=UPI0028AA91E9|nr:type VI secretion system TssO [Kaistella carnis]